MLVEAALLNVQIGINHSTAHASTPPQQFAKVRGWSGKLYVRQRHARRPNRGRLLLSGHSRSVELLSDLLRICSHSTTRSRLALCSLTFLFCISQSQKLVDEQQQVLLVCSDIHTYIIIGVTLGAASLHKHLVFKINLPVQSPRRISP